MSDDPSDPIDPLTYVEPDGDHLLHVAAWLGDLRTVELLIKAGLDVNVVGDMGCTPLHIARMQKHDQVAQMLLRNGASETIVDEFGKLPNDY